VALGRTGALESVGVAGLESADVDTRTPGALAAAGRDADRVRVDFLGAPDLLPDGSCAVRRDESTGDFDGRDDFDGCDVELPSGVSATATPGVAVTARPRLSANAAEPTRKPNAVELMAPPYLDGLSATFSINA
jgi:hypothetical protein